MSMDTVATATMAWTWVSHEDSEEYGMMEGAPAYALMDSVEQRAGHQAGPRVLDRRTA